MFVQQSHLGEKIKDGKNQKTVLREYEEQEIVNLFNSKQEVENFSIKVTYDEVSNKNYSFSAGQYFDIKIEYTEMTPETFKSQLNNSISNIKELFIQSNKLEANIEKKLETLKYD